MPILIRRNDGPKGSTFGHLFDVSSVFIDLQAGKFIEATRNRGEPTRIDRGKELALPMTEKINERLIECEEHSHEYKCRECQFSLLVHPHCP